MEHLTLQVALPCIVHKHPRDSRDQFMLIQGNSDALFTRKSFSFHFINSWIALAHDISLIDAAARP